MSRSAKVVVFILFVLVLISLALNGLIIWQLLQVQRQAQRVVREFGPAVQEGLDQTISDLENFEETQLEFEIEVDQDFPVQTEIGFDEAIEVPIQLDVPISQTIETTVFIELVGGVEVPVDIAVPVDVEVPIDNTLVIPFERTIPISATVPLKAEVPIQVDVSESPLAEQVARLRQDLMSLSAFIEQVLIEFE